MASGLIFIHSIMDYTQKVLNQINLVLEKPAMLVVQSQPWKT